jgi:hypothetical protein
MSDSNGNGEQPQNGEERGEGGLVERRDAAIEERAISQRWPIPEKYREPIMKKAIAKLIDPNTSDRNFNQTLNALLKAEAQNQADEHKQQPDQIDINLTGNGIRIIEDDDWYGNRERLNALAAESSDENSDGPGPLQGRGGRPPMGKNGNGTTGSH